MDNQAEWLTAYVEKCMVEVWEDEPDALFSVGDMVAFQSGTAACLVRVEGALRPWSG